MPNHITTEVEISGTKAKISKLIKDTKIKLETDIDNEFDFNGIIKMPKSMHITSGTSTELGMAAYDQTSFNKYAAYGWFTERYGNAQSPEELRAFMKASDDEGNKNALKEGKIAIDNLRKYGAKDWYDWSNEHWGTKWNAYDVHYLDHSDTKLVVQLSTAWDTPHKIWQALEDKGYTVKGVYYGEMDGYEFIGNGDEVFEAYQTVETQYFGK